MDAPPAPSKPDLHILVLNDDPATLQKLSSWLEAEGVEETSEDLRDLLAAVYRVTSPVGRP
jgi:CheY-like chemotaxis protein